MVLRVNRVVIDVRVIWVVIDVRFIRVLWSLGLGYGYFRYYG